ncbi:hypothetical protein A6A04_20115 [Paramagnetospirillum marisnigri]|uniref:Double Cache domain-containing protein n=1 Tax=Paramagnetospirillum marisnigri TaxID=1285242 RepID=A0A178MIH3_9PROT|nr:cache domain-containing protein [Paramagnetospirillum marisnigri]OAN48440.1 hypothetical protein A6A04_20115 [Paramagnetospirillum marisnigri]
MTAASSGEKKPKASAGTSRLVIVLAVAAVAAVVSAFYSINEYANGTGAIVSSADKNAGRFEMVFRDFIQARMRAMSIAADTMLQSRINMEAFAKDDRAGLVSRIDPFFTEILSKDHGVTNLAFWKAPATLYYRAGDSKNFGQDLSGFRKTVVAANERRQRVLAIETGMGGLIAIRAVVPIFFEDKHVGALDFGTSFAIPLERAMATSGLQWAVGLQKEVSARVERPADAKVDAWKGNDVFYLYSDQATGEAVRAAEFDPRGKGYTLTQVGDKTVFIKSFPVVNFSGVPTIVVATVLDVSDAFAAVLKSVAIKTAILFLAITILGSFGIIKFGDMKSGLLGAMGRQKRELDERAAACDAAVAKLKDVDLIKRGFFTNLVAAVSEPLQAVAGQLQSVGPAIETVVNGQPPEPATRDMIRERFAFAVAETSRLSRLVADYQQLEMFRQKLVKADNPLLSLSEVVGRTINEDMAGYRRLPQLSITAAVPADLPVTRADPDMLRRAISGLVGYAAQRAGQGKIALTGRVDEAGWLEVKLSGSAYAAAGAPDDALLDESRQFISRLGTSAMANANGAPLVGVVLSRIIIEYFGGSLEASANAKDPGFLFRLPVAA